MSFLVLDYMAMVLQPQDLESLWNLAFMIYKEGFRLEMTSLLWVLELATVNIWL